MKLDRILLDLIEWVRKVILSRKDESVVKPYVIVEYAKRYSTGSVTRIERSERYAPRHVDCYVYIPFPKDESFRLRQKLKDIYIFLDHLRIVPGLKDSKTTFSRYHTHLITIIEASHDFLGSVDEDDPGLLEFDVELLFKGSYDLQGRSEYPDFLARKILKEVVIILAEGGLKDYNLRKDSGRKLFHGEIENSRKRFLGGGYKPNDYTHL